MLALVGAFVLAGCEANDPTEDTAMIGFDLEPLFDGAALQVNTTLQFDDRAALLETARLYLSDLTLLHEDGLDYDEPFNRFCMTGDCPDMVQTVKANVADAFELFGVEGH